MKQEIALEYVEKAIRIDFTKLVVLDLDLLVDLLKKYELASSR